MKVRVLGGESVYALPELPVHQVAPEDHLRRVLGEWVVEVAHSANLVVLRTPPGSAHVVGSALDRCGFEGVVGTVAGDDTVLVVAAEEPGGSVVATRIAEVVGMTTENGATVMAKRVVLAYSGGLDTSVAVTWLRRGAGPRGGGGGRRRRPGRRLRGDPPAGPGGRGGRVGRHRRPGRDGRRLRGPRHRRQRPLRREVPTRLGAVAPRHRPPPGGRGAPSRRRRRGPRLHGEGQRPGPLRGGDARPGPRSRDPRPGASVGDVARRLRRLRGRPRDPHRGDEGEDVLDRREPLGPGHRVRRHRGPLGTAAGRRLHA